LLLFNDHERLTEGEITEYSCLESGETRRNIASLIETKIMKKDGEHYLLNLKFVSKRIRFKISNTMLAETKLENEATKKAIQSERTYFLQAVVVRIMKSRQRLPHSELIQEVIAQTHSRFQPQISLIKQCIETLIEKEYMGRTGEGDYEYRA